jgi:hypothetical protein
MKKITMIGLVSLLGTGAYAQGTLAFFNDNSDCQFQIYSPNPANPSAEQTGFTAAQASVQFGVTGTTVYNGTPIGGSSGSAPGTLGVTSAAYADGNLFDVQLYAAPAGTDSSGANTPTSLSSLSPVSQYFSTFTTSGGSANAYFINPEPSPDAGIPGTALQGSTLINNAYVSVVAWYNGGGQYSTLALARAAGVPWGYSPIVDENGLGEPSSVETALNHGRTTPGSFPTELYGVPSFSLATTPEPSTIALGVMGVGAFLARRRKK